MECPKCKSKMQLRVDDYSFNKDNKEYKRKIYWCKTDDVWISIEMPSDNN